MSMRRRPDALGMVIVRTPFCRSAATADASTVGGQGERAAEAAVAALDPFEAHRPGVAGRPLALERDLSVLDRELDVVP